MYDRDRDYIDGQRVSNIMFFRSMNSKTLTRFGNKVTISTFKTGHYDERI